MVLLDNCFASPWTNIAIGNDDSVAGDSALTKINNNNVVKSNNKKAKITTLYEDDPKKKTVASSSSNSLTAMDTSSSSSRTVTTACSSTTGSSITNSSSTVGLHHGRSSAASQSPASFELGIPAFVTPQPKVKRPLHEEKTLNSITSELCKLTISDQVGMSDIIKYCKAGTENVNSYDELNQLSMEERELVFYDIHGVSYDDDNDSSPVEKKALKEMSKAIDSLVGSAATAAAEVSSSPDDSTSLGSSSSSTSGRAYLMAKAQSSTYVEDRKRRLLFLLADQMNPSLAAQRYVDFFEQKLALFGPTNLSQDICLADLTSQDMEFLSQGSFQMLPTRDRAGRAVFAHLPVFMKPPKEQENMLRSIYYILMSALEDKETQKKGIVFVWSRFVGSASGGTSTSSKPSPELTQKALELFRTLPIRICGWHYATDDKLFSLLLPLVAQRFEKQARIRLRVHYGSYMECCYNLMTFGLPVGDYPMTDDMRDIKRQKHSKWITARRNLELMKRRQVQPGGSSSSSKDQQPDLDGATLLPSHGDILFGRGKPVQEHPGNLGLNILVESMAPAYAKCRGKKQKMDLTQSIVLNIKAKGGRFIKQVDTKGCNGIWVEVDDETARGKVSHTFRNIKMQHMQQQKQQQALQQQQLASGATWGGGKRQRPT